MNRRIPQLTFGVGIAAIAVLSWGLFVTVIGPARYDAGVVPNIGWWLALTALLVVSSYGLGLPELPISRVETIWRSSAAVLLSIAAVSLVQLVTLSSLIPRSSLAIVATLVPVWALISWNVATDLQRWSESRDRVLLVCHEPGDVAALRAELDLHPETPAAIVADLRIDEARIRNDGVQPLLLLGRDVGATVVVLDRAAQAEASIVDQVRGLHQDGVRVRTLALFYEEWLGKLPVSELAQTSLLFDVGELHRARYARAKRLLDLAIGLPGVIVLLGMIPVVWLTNLVGNRGPLFFRQVRVGKNGEEFAMLKFRTMTTGSNVSDWTSHDDQRITRFGQVLRKLHLDEFPQMINIVRGELSVVGPRPEQPHYVKELAEKVPFYEARLMARPGLTGWAQVKYGYASSEADALEKLQFDFYYLRRQSIVLDLQILSRTIREVIGGLGR